MEGRDRSLIKGTIKTFVWRERGLFMRIYASLLSDDINTKNKDLEVLLGAVKEVSPENSIK
jgi:hypothetical protein